MVYPSTLSTFTDPQPTDRLNSPSHSGIEIAQNDGLRQLQAFVGTSSSTAGTLMYDIRAAASNGGGHVQTANKGGTGQTSFTKGDILVATSSSVLTKLAVGIDGQALVVNSSTASGVSWSQPFATPTVRTYETSSSIYTWVKPASILYAVIRLQAPGGNGLAATGGGIGAGGGGYAEKVVAAASLPAAASILIRAGGTGSILSYFGSILSATGGENATASTGGAGGGATGGDFNVSGQKGQDQVNNGGRTGAAGGNSFMGFGGAAGAAGNDINTSNDAGLAGGYGGGGAGPGAATDGTPTGTASNGTGGFAMITEFK